MRISTKKLPDDKGALRVHLDGRPSSLLIAFDSTMKEWDLCTEEEFLFSANAKGTLLRRLELMASIIGAAC